MARVTRLVVTGLLLAAACTRTAREPGEETTVYPVERSIVIGVVNHSQLDVVVYIAHDGVRDRLGAVTAATTATFPVRGRTLATGSFVLLADVVGSFRTATSETLHISQGAEFTWTLESDFARATVMVRGD